MEGIRVRWKKERSKGEKDKGGRIEERKRRGEGGKKGV